MTGNMEALKSDTPKLPDMVMCGDHPSFTKTEPTVNMDDKEKEKPKDKNTPSYAKISPTSSRTEGPAVCGAGGARSSAELVEARRRVRDLERERPDLAHGTARPLVQAFPWTALGSFRWPPYLLAVWVLVLVLTHVLHCLAGGLGRALPTLKRCTQYFRTWTEDTWREQSEINQKLVPVGLAGVTAALYAVYFALYALYGVVLWAIEPLCADDEPRPARDVEAKLIDYIEGATSNTSSNIKQ